MRAHTFAAFALAAAVTAQGNEAAPLPGRIEGIVVDALGEPVPAAEVWVTERRQPLAQTRTDASGTFQLPGLPLAQLEVHARAPGKTHVQVPARLDRDAPLRAVELRLRAALPLRGTVTRAGGAAIAGATVLVTPGPYPFTAAIATTTDAQGNYRLELPHGEHDLLVFADGCAAVLREVVANAATPPCDFELAATPSRALVVQIHGATEAQLRRAECSAAFGFAGRILDLPTAMSRGRPDARGDWVVEGLPGNLQFLDQRVLVPGCKVEMQRGELQNGRFFAAYAASPIGPLRGRMLDADGKPLANRALRCRTAAGDTMLTTDDQGAFTAADQLAFGERFELQPIDATLARRRTDGEYDSGADFDPKRTYTLATVAAHALTGRVLDSEGRPVHGAEVVLTASTVSSRRHSGLPFTATATSDANGDYNFRQLDVTGLADLRVVGHHFAHASAGVDCELTDRPTTVAPKLQLSRHAVVRGVLRGKNGAPLAFTVLMLVKDGTSGERRMQVSTDQDGRFVSRCEAGTWQPMLARDRTSSSPVGGPLQLKAGETTEIELQFGR